MMKNPLTEERLQKLQEDAQELLENFGLLFAKNFGVAVFEKIQAELQTPEKTEWKLSHRPWDSVKSKPFGGECFVKSGEGPDSFASWKKVYVVEREDFSIDFFPDEKSCTAGKQPQLTISTAGYNVVTDVSGHFASELRKMSEPLDLSEEQISSMATFSHYSWALTHPQRPNYIFQLHKSKESSCSCFGGGAKVEPDELGAEKRDEILLWVRTMKKLTSKANPQGDTLIARALNLTCQQIGLKVPSLRNWTDNGTEAEMLVDMLMEALLPGLRDDILRELTVPVSMKLKMWYKTRSVIQQTLKKVADPAWAKMEQGTNAIQEKVEPVIRPGIAKIVEIKGKVEDKIKVAVGDRLGRLLGQHVTPFVKPIIDAFEEPLKKGFVNGRSVFDSNIDLLQLPSDKEERNKVLDGLARDPEKVGDLKQAAADVTGPLRALTSLSSEVFDFVDAELLSAQAEELLLEALDSVAYTVIVRLDEGQPADSLKEQLMKDFEYDVVIMRCVFVKATARNLLIGAFKKIAAPVTEEIISTVNDAIPEEMQDFLNIENIIDKFIDVFVGTPIDKTIEAAFPRP